MNNKPLISVVIPCYNQAHFLTETLESVLNQTLNNWECIIVNDGSPDNTDEVSEKWVKKDKRFKYIYKDNGGLPSARNAGIAISDSEYILPLDSDDKIHPSFLEKIIQAFNNNPSLELVCSRIQLFGVKNEELILPNYNYNQLLLQNCFGHCSAFKKRTWKAINGYDENLKSFEDWEFWIRLLKNNGKVYKIPELLFIYRKHESNSLSNRFYTDGEFYFSLYNYVYKKHIDLYINTFPNFIFVYKDYLKFKAFNEKVKRNILFKIYNQFKKMLKK
ncbi:glycosyltransferase [Flavivirga amylovorans]|uniref:Glycosyltransferase n=1 Tax=Flavivirga amylovorans TaxID=870486 RepID=A0ABT8WXH2_9FLAO|nr:glycosyltransferase [Flavivirga amylovorans]MDO5986376.1 glycosyltransferase [Flavivirga amylovorans]